MKRLGNGSGSVYKLSGNRRNPWTARKTVGWNDKGQPKYKFIGFYRTRSDAIKALMEYNKSPYSLEGETLLQIYEKFIVGYEQNHKSKTIKAFKSKWKHLAPLYNEPVAQLTRKKLQLYFDNLNASKLVKGKVKMVLKAILDYSVRYDVIPAERLIILKFIDLSSQIVNDTVEHTAYTREEIERLKQINDEMSKTILFLIYTGLRAGEFCDLTDKSIDEDMVIHVLDSKTEAGIRDVPISDKAQKLAPIPHFSSYDRLYYKYRAWNKKHDFDHTLHDTRHTLVTLLTESKVDERIIQSIVGHKGTGVTQEVYTHISIETKREALNKI